MKDKMNTVPFGSERASNFASVLAKTSRLRIALPWITAYALVSYLTGAFFMADTVDYATDVYSRYRGNTNTLWEFGHLLWRPLGWISLRTLGPLMGLLAGPDPRIQVTYIFVALNWLTGLACILLLRAFLLRFSVRPIIAGCCTLGLLFSNAFLNYIHSGSSYIPGLAFLLLGFYLLAAHPQTDTSKLRPVWAACALALAVCLWFPYIFAVPGALATPLFHRNADQLRWTLTLRTTFYCLILGLSSYGLVLCSLGIFTPDALFRWVTAEATAIGGVSGLTRAVFGLARSFINMGDDGVLFKRFLLHDPYNPVTIFQLCRGSLLKLFLFYSLLIVVLKQLLHSANRRIVWLCLAVAIPVFAFALLWYGGDMERYLPLYPAFFLAVGCALSNDRTPAYLTWLGTVILLFSIFSNFVATSNFTLKKEQQRVEERMNDLLPLLGPDSRVVLLDIHDELENFVRSFPFHIIVRGGMLRTYPVLNIGTAEDFHWRQDLARIVLNTWRSGGDIWVSKRVLEPRPHRNWNWVEGADSHATWSMVQSFFKEFDYGRSIGAEDGFILLRPTEKNKAIIISLQNGDTGVRSPSNPKQPRNACTSNQEITALSLMEKACWASALCWVGAWEHLTVYYKIPDYRGPQLEERFVTNIIRISTSF